jgi:hypothetical protein
LFWVDFGPVYWVKNKGPCFSDHHRDRILGCAHDMSSADIGDAAFFYILGADDASSSPSNLKQKVLHAGRCSTGSGVGPDLLDPATLDLIFLFLVFLK